ncbi:thermostable hemolysin [Marinicella sp. S1101]|uniref:thermostable hemolysin n=1 Tax=Marinicella marina TaxID=2996016 RepID=UPI00226095A6|nr:thermostable hemolysin [Marinicella marina]MCX7554200.1 thermostable hemolysin [Marinicella marina]MDJ1141107.1 thermostable hemolysin [Marinicella marina]
MLISPADDNRAAVEEFIADGYEKHFSAKLMDFFPIILAIKDDENDRYLGAVGLRYADDYKLFSENYLSHSIEFELEQKELNAIDRDEIIELGHFVVGRNSDVNTVIPLVGQFLKTLNVRWAIYTLSRPIKVAFNRLGIKLTHLQHAHQAALFDSKTDWGRYYDFKPAVYYSDITRNLI